MAIGLAACDDVAMTGAAPSAGASGPSGGGAFREFIVLGSSMSFEQCKARGGFIIRDAGSPMTACDPNVLHTPTPENEFDNPDNNADELAAREAVQLHGGVGMTDAIDIGFFMKRVRTAEAMLGDSNLHADRFARLKGY